MALVNATANSGSGLLDGNHEVALFTVVGMPGLMLDSCRASRTENAGTSFEA